MRDLPDRLRTVWLTVKNMIVRLEPGLAAYIVDMCESYSLSGATDDLTRLLHAHDHKGTWLLYAADARGHFLMWFDDTEERERARSEDARFVETGDSLLKVVEVLLDHGACVRPSELCWHPVHAAVLQDNWPIADAMLSRCPWGSAAHDAVQGNSVWLGLPAHCAYDKSACEQSWRVLGEHGDIALMKSVKGIGGLSLDDAPKMQALDGGRVFYAPAEREIAATVTTARTRPQPLSPSLPGSPQARGLAGVGRDSVDPAVAEAEAADARERASRGSMSAKRAEAAEQKRQQQDQLDAERAAAHEAQEGGPSAPDLNTGEGQLRALMDDIGIKEHGDCDATAAASAANAPTGTLAATVPADGGDAQSSTNSDDADTQCPVCLEECEERTTAHPCGQHAFCFACIDRWVSERSATCPICRVPVEKLMPPPPRDEKLVMALDSELSTVRARHASSPPAMLTTHS